MTGSNMMKSRLIFGLLVVAGMTQTAQAQDAAAGEQVFRKCLPCHAIGPGAKNKYGPELNGLDGRHSGSVAGYNYSSANKKSGIVWNEKTFEKYIKESARDGSTARRCSLPAYPELRTFQCTKCGDVRTKERGQEQ